MWETLDELDFSSKARNWLLVLKCILMQTTSKTRSTPVKNGYMAEMGLHKQALEEALTCIPEDGDERGATSLEDLQESLDTLV